MPEHLTFFGWGLFGRRISDVTESHKFLVFSITGYLYLVSPTVAALKGLCYGSVSTRLGVFNRRRF
jgi:hypothetical protein